MSTTYQDLLMAMRDLIEAAEAAGWDGDKDNAPILQAARDAFAACYPDDVLAEG